jgi:uncharacterized protein (DUF2384 family)
MTAETLPAYWAEACPVGGWHRRRHWNAIGVCRHLDGHGSVWVSTRVSANLLDRPAPVVGRESPDDVVAASPGGDPLDRAHRRAETECIRQR